LAISLIHDLERTNLNQDRAEQAVLQWDLRCVQRVHALLAEVKVDELVGADEDSGCKICYNDLRGLATNLVRPPVRLPCGHIFCRACIVAWLQEAPGTCPSCRTDFNLVRDNNADCVISRNAVLRVAQVDIFALVPTPWWLAILRSEVDPMNDAAGYCM
jgi:hypothetical protein